MIQMMILEDIQKEIFFGEAQQIQTAQSFSSLGKVVDFSSSNLGRSALDISMSWVNLDPRSSSLNSSISKSFNFGSSFRNLVNIINKNPTSSWILFDYFHLGFSHLLKLKDTIRVKNEFSTWTDILIKFAEFLIDLDEKKMTKLACMLPPQMVYRFILATPIYYDRIKLNLLQHLESLGKQSLIEDKILFFTLIIKFRPEHANRFIDTLEPKYHSKCLEIAKKKHNFGAQAHIQFKRGRYVDCFNLYSKM